MAISEQIAKPRRITLTAEQRWLTGWILLTLGLAALPFVWGWVITPSGQQFTGFLMNATDGNSYLAKMEEGREGSWQFYLIYTSEPGSTGAYTFLFYLLLGKLAGLLSLPNIVVFHLARIAGGLALLLVSYRFIRLVFSNPLHQRFAFRLVCLASGLGWLIFLFKPNPPDFWVTEGYTFQSIFVNPHFPVATALLVYVIIECLHGLEGRGFRAYWKAWVAAFALGFVHPFLLFTLAGVLGVYWLRRVLTFRKMGWSGFVGLVLTGAAAVPGSFLTWWGTTHDALLNRWMAQNSNPSLDVLTMLGMYGLLVPLALAGLWWVEKVLREKKGEDKDETTLLHWRLVTTWLIVTVVLLALPSNFSRRFLEGIHLPLCCLATAGYFYIFPRAGWQLKEKALTLILSLSTLIIVVIAVMVLYFAKPTLYDPVFSPYLSQGELEAIAWLQQNTKPGEVIMTGPVLGNTLPGRVLRPVFYGHLYETVDAPRKLNQVEQFFDASTPATFRENLIHDEGLDYLVYGWREKELGGFDPTSAGWPLLFDQDGVQIYRLT